MKYYYSLLTYLFLIAFFTIQISCGTYTINPVSQTNLGFQSELLVVDINDQYAYVGSVDGQIKKINLQQNNEIIHTQDICLKIFEMLLMHDDQYLLVACNEEGLKVFELIENQETFSEITQPFSLDYQAIFIVNVDSKVYVQTQSDVVVLDFSDNGDYEELAILSTVGLSQVIDVSPDNKYLFAAKDAFGFEIYDISNLNNPQFVTSDIFEGAYGVKWVKIHPITQHIFVCTKWDYIGVINYGQYYGQEQNYPIEFQLAGKYIDPTYSEKYDMHISNDGTSCYITCNGQGVFVLDITDISNIKLVQVLEQPGLIKKMKLPQINQDFVYLTNSRDLIVYEQIEPIYKQNNLFTAYQSEKWNGPTQEVWPWTQAITHDNTRLYLMLIVDGIRVYDLTSLPQLTLLHQYKDPVIPGLDSPFHVIVDILNENILYVGNYNAEGLFIIDFTDVANPVKLGSVTLTDEVGYSVHIIKADPHKVIINARTNIYIVDVEDKTNPLIISSNEPTEYVITQFRKGKISNDGSFLYFCELVLGQLFTFEVKNNYRNIVNVDVQPMELGYLIEMSRLRDDVMYGLVNLGGIYVYDISNGVPEVKKLVELEGFLWDIDMDWQEHNLFVVATQRNQLMMLDISDPFQAYLINIFQVNTEQGFQVILVSGQYIKDYVIVNTFNGIRAVPLDVDVSLNIQIFSYDSDKQVYNNYVQQEDSASLFPIYYVGEIGKAQFQVLNDPFGQKIYKFYYYTVDQPTLLIENTPVIQFDTTKKEIKFQAQKDNLGINTVATKVFINIKVEELVNTELENIVIGQVDSQGEFLVNTEIAEQIYTKATEFGYISVDGFPTDMFDLNKKIIMLEDIQQYADYLKNIIKNKIQFVPFTFVVKESLYFNQSLNQSSESQKIINSFAESVEVTFKVDQNKAEFFNIPYEGVLSSYSQNKDELVIQGKISSINIILNQVKIEKNSSVNIEDIIVQIKIDDYLNISQEYNLPLQEIKFIKINQHVKEGESIQEQFEQLYSGSSVTVEEEFQFSFARESFEDDDEVIYEVHVYVESEEKEYQISQYTSFENFEINFVENQRMIKGTVNRNMFRGKLNLRIVADDGYSQAEQELILNLNGVPVVMIIEYLVIFGSGLISIIGGIQYRGKIYGIICKSRYRLGNIYIQENENFIFQMILGKEDMVIAQRHYKILKIHLQNRSQDFKELLDMHQPGTYTLDREKIKRILVIECPQLDQLGYEHDESITFCMLKSLIQRTLMDQKKKSKKLYDKLKQLAMKQTGLNKHRWFEFYVEVRPVEVTNFYDITPKIFFKSSVIINALQLLINEKKMNKQEKNVIYDEFLQINDKEFYCYEIEDPTFSDKIFGLGPEFMDYKVPLVLENIRTAAWGFKRTSLINYTFGQTIMKSTQLIKVARAMVKRKSIFTPLFKYINLDYIDIPLAVNTPLPQWMDYTQHHNVMEIYGKIPVDDSINPEKKDLVIRIEDLFDFTCREFHIVQVRHTVKNKIIHYTDYKAPDLKINEDDEYELEEDNQQNEENQEDNVVVIRKKQKSKASKKGKSQQNSPQVNSAIQPQTEINTLLLNQTPRIQQEQLQQQDISQLQSNDNSQMQIISQRNQIFSKLGNNSSNFNSFQLNQDNQIENLQNIDQIQDKNIDKQQQQLQQQQLLKQQQQSINQQQINMQGNSINSQKYSQKIQNQNQKEVQFQISNEVESNQINKNVFFQNLNYSKSENIKKGINDQQNNQEIKKKNYKNSIYNNDLQGKNIDLGETQQQNQNIDINKEEQDMNYEQNQENNQNQIELSENQSQKTSYYKDKNKLPKQYTSDALSALQQ